MRFAAAAVITSVALFATGACATGPRTSTPGATPSVPTPEVPLPPIAAVPLSAAPGPWSFTYTDGANRYSVTRSITIEDRSATVGRREIINDWHMETVSLTVESPERHIIEAVLDTLEVAPGSAPQDSLGLPVTVRVHRIGDQLQFQAEDSHDACTPAAGILTGDIRILAARLPETLKKNATWTSTDSTKSCQGGITMSSVATHNYTVLGEAEGKFAGLVQVRRTTTVNGRGEGVQLRHRVRLSATGTETADYYVELSAARISTVRAEQQLDIQVENSGRLHKFSQQTRREFGVVR